MKKRKEDTKDKDYEEFVKRQTETDGGSEYEYSDSATIKNRFRYFLFGSKSRLKKTYRKFI